MSTRISNTADVEAHAKIGRDTVVWHLAQVRKRARVGAQCIIGRGAYIDVGVEVGDRCKIQNYALVYAPARLEDGVFIGPAAVLTNDLFPRAVSPDGSLKKADDWEPTAVVVRQGAAVGANAVVVPGVVIGRWALVGAGAVVTRDVPDHSLVVGVPARQVGWVGRSGRPLEPAQEGRWRCPQTGTFYRVEDDALVEER